MLHMMNDISNGTLSEECINYDAFLAEYDRTKHNCYQYGKVELARVNYLEALKNFLLGNHFNAMRTFWRISENQ